MGVRWDLRRPEKEWATAGSLPSPVDSRKDTDRQHNQNADVADCLALVDGVAEHEELGQ